ncbi:hypothetical protein ACM66B_004849 [Microbotryomycetes sp. NB124-2]
MLPSSGERVQQSRSASCTRAAPARLDRPALIEFPPRHSVTPPPTPTDSTHLSTSTDLLAIPSMFELTRQKLERAAQAQLSGRRGAGGLRELVLLSNMFGSTLSSSSASSQEQQQQQCADASRQTPPESIDSARELEDERRRKLDEERWLDGVLEEMLEEDEDGSEAEAYVSLTLRDSNAYGPGDSGFLEAVAKHPSALDRAAVVELEQISEEDAEPYGGASALESAYPPTAPIALPEASARPFDSTASDDLFESPPFFPPSLTPDHSPSAPSPARDMLSASVDSIATVDSWISDLSMNRLGIAALDLSSCSTKPSSTMAIEREDPARDLRLSISPTSLDLAIRSKSWWPDTLKHRPMPLINFKSCLDCIDFGHAPLATAATGAADDTKSTKDDATISTGPRGRKESLALVLAGDPPPHSAITAAAIGPRHLALWRSRSLSPDGT